ncbi:MAG: Mu-like prophage major head subunit gpT family protein [Anaerolineae bacterium]|nr:Mu-like prophage major head subunit gpT family protein [Anaerolineae bacterium]
MWTQVELAVSAGSGREFEVVCIRPGRANGLEYPPEVLAASVPLWDGVTSFVDHASALDRTRVGYRSVRDVCGVVASPAWEASRGIVARLRLTGRAGEELAPLLEALVQARQTAQPAPNVGLSADLLVAHDGRRVQAIERVLAVDVVVAPAAGGSVERVLNARRGLAEEGEGTSADGNTGEAPRVGLERPASDGVQVQAAPPEAPQGERAMSESNEMDAVTPTLAELHNELEEARVARRELASAYLRTALAASGLPLPMQQAVQVRLAQRKDYTVADVVHEVEAQRTVWAALQEEQTVQNLGPRPQVTAMQDELDRLQLACEHLLGLPLPDSQRDVPRLTGLRELYLLLTGDHEMRGVFVPERVTLANVTTGTMTSIVKNALNKVLVRSFEARPQWWQPIVVEEDFPTLNDVTWITLGGFGDLATVPEGSAYAEVANLTDAEEVSAWTKKGGYIGITLETIDRDDVAAIRQIPRKLGLAAWRTLSASVAGLFTANSGVGPYWPGSQSTYRLFDAQYGNLGTSALSAASWDATVQAMFRQTEAGSGRRLGVRPKWLLVPIELEKTALTIMKSAGEPGTGNNDANVRAGTFGVITVPEFTDANDWAAAADPADLPGICIGYRFGRTPELFVADDATIGSMFTHDEMRIKVRFLYTIGVADPKALYKHNVA